MAEKLRAPLAVLVLAGIVWIVGARFDDENLKETCTTGAVVIALVGLFLAFRALTDSSD